MQDTNRIIAQTKINGSFSIMEVHGIVGVTCPFKYMYLYILSQGSGACMCDHGQNNTRFYKIHFTPELFLSKIS